MSDDVYAFDTLSRNLLLYGKMLFNLETEEANGCRRVRIIELDGVKYVHHMFNGELIELIKL